MGGRILDMLLCVCVDCVYAVQVSLKVMYTGERNKCKIPCDVEYTREK